MNHAMVSVGGMIHQPKYYGDPEHLLRVCSQGKTNCRVEVRAEKFE